MHPTLSRLLDSFSDGVARAMPTAALSNPIAIEVIQELRRAGATAPESAQPFRSRSALESAAFRRLLGVGVIQEQSPGRYFLDERALRRLASS